MDSLKSPKKKNKKKNQILYQIVESLGNKTENIFLVAYV